MPRCRCIYCFICKCNLFIFKLKCVCGTETFFYHIVVVQITEKQLSLILFHISLFPDSMKLKLDLLPGHYQSYSGPTVGSPEVMLLRFSILFRPMHSRFDSNPSITNWCVSMIVMHINWPNNSCGRFCWWSKRSEKESQYKDDPTFYAGLEVSAKLTWCSLHHYGMENNIQANSTAW